MFRPNSQTARRHVVFRLLLGYKWRMEIGRVLGYFSPMFGAVTSEKSSHPGAKEASAVNAQIVPVVPVINQFVLKHVARS